MVNDTESHEKVQLNQQGHSSSNFLFTLSVKPTKTVLIPEARIKWIQIIYRMQQFQELQSHHTLLKFAQESDVSVQLVIIQYSGFQIQDLSTILFQVCCFGMALHHSFCQSSQAVGPPQMPPLWQRKEHRSPYLDSMRYIILSGGVASPRKPGAIGI